MAQGRGIVHGATTCRLQCGKCRGPDGGRAAVARAGGRSSRSVSDRSARIYPSIFDARRAADRRSRQPEARRCAQGDTAEWDTGWVWNYEFGVSTSLSPKTSNISVPYGALVPEKLDNVLGAGRHGAWDPSSHTFLREIPQCWFTAQAAGVAAALVTASATRTRDLAPTTIQRELLRQGAYLLPTTEAALAPAAAE